VLPVGTLLTIFGFLLSRTAAVCSGNVFLLLCLGLHLALVWVATLSATTEGDAILQDLLKILFSCHTVNDINSPPLREGPGVGLNGGTDVRQ